jgi:hypothetical protein
MGLGLLLLVSVGKENIYLSTQPDITFFKVAYKRYTNFSTEPIAQYFTQTIDFSKKAACPISRNADLVGQMFLVVTLPAINFTANTNLITLDQVSKSENVTVFWVGTLQQSYYTAIWGHYSNIDPGTNDVALRKQDWQSFINFGSYDINNCMIPIINFGEQLIIYATMQNGTIMNINAIYLNGQIHISNQQNNGNQEMQIYILVQQKAQMHILIHLYLKIYIIKESYHN